MTEDPALLRRRALAFAEVNQRLHAELDATVVRRKGQAPRYRLVSVITAAPLSPGGWA